MTDEPLTILIETPDGPIVRQIVAASPLRDDLPPGEAAEVAAQDAASIWGMPDFVYRAATHRAGAASREVGDRLLLVGSAGIVVQVKSRVALTSSADKESAWLLKQTRKALRQANGTIRTLRGGVVQITNARGRTVEISGGEYAWMTTVVLDHPNVPAGLTLSLAESKYPAVVLARRDWEFLFRQLKSTHAVCGYLRRVAGQPHELGLEPTRFFQLALADHQAAPTPLDPALVGEGYEFSSPLLPLEEAASDNTRAHLLYRAILEDIAITPTEGIEEERRLRVLAELDRLPVSSRANIGEFLSDGLESTKDAPLDTAVWRFRRVIGPFGAERNAHLGFGTCSGGEDLHRQAFSTWVQLRHHQLQKTTGDSELTTVGVLLTLRTDEKRSFDTTMSAVSGDLELTNEEVTTLERLWPQGDDGEPTA